MPSSYPSGRFSLIALRTALSAARRSAGVRRGIGPRWKLSCWRRYPCLEVRAHVFPHLVMPVRPFVPALRAPVVQMMSDPAVPKHIGHSIGGAAVLPWTTAGHEPDVATGVLV